MVREKFIEEIKDYSEGELYQLLLSYKIDDGVITKKELNNVVDMVVRQWVPSDGWEKVVSTITNAPWYNSKASYYLAESDIFNLEDLNTIQELTQDDLRVVFILRMDSKGLWDMGEAHESKEDVKKRLIKQFEKEKETQAKILKGLNSTLEEQDDFLDYINCHEIFAYSESGEKIHVNEDALMGYKQKHEDLIDEIREVQDKLFDINVRMDALTDKAGEQVARVKELW